MELGWWPWWWDKAHVLAFAHMINVFVRTIFCILWCFFCCMCPYVLLTFFLVASTFGLHSRPWPKVWARGRGERTVCGPNGGMWTQVGDMMNGVIMSGKGEIYVDERVGPHNQNHGFLWSTIPKSKRVDKWDSTGLEYKVNIQKGYRGREHKPSPFFQPYPPWIHAQKCPW